MKDNKIGIIIIAVIVVLGFAVVSININNSNNKCDTTTNANAKVFDGFDPKVLVMNANKMTYEALNADTLKNLFLDGINRAGLITANHVEDYKVSILQDDESRDRFKYSAKGEFKCNNTTTCTVNVNGEYICDNICLNVPIEDYNEKTGYFSFVQKFTIKLDNGKYSFNEFDFEEKFDEINMVKSNGEE